MAARILDAVASEPPLRLEDAAEEPHSPRTVSGKRPSPAALQREREYFDWLLERPQHEGDAPQSDHSKTAFMAERRVAKERARSQQRAIARRHERFRRRHGHSPPPEQRRAQAPAHEEAGPLPKRPRGRPRDPLTPQRRLDKAVACIGAAAARSERQSFESNQMRGEGRLASCPRELRGWPKRVIWWRRRAETIARRGCSTGQMTGDFPVAGTAAEF